MILIDIQIKAANLSLEVLNPYNQAKENELNTLYNIALGTCRHIMGWNCDAVYKTRVKLSRFFRHVRYSQYCPHRDNINKVLRNLSKTNLYLNENSNIIIQNFINKFWIIILLFSFKYKFVLDKFLKTLLILSL